MMYVLYGSPIGLWHRGQPRRRNAPDRHSKHLASPVVAFVDRGRVRVWGDTPRSSPDRVVVERSFRGG